VEKQKTWKIGEKAAREYLSGSGYKIVEKNRKFRFGEIDIIALQGGNLVFVEVKTTHWEAGVENLWKPEDNLTPAKRRNMKRAALYYLNQILGGNKGIKGMRIDVITVLLQRNHASLRHYKNALAL